MPQQLNNFVPYMQRCLQLAKQGLGMVAPNPMVGAVLVMEGKIVGEGFHEKFGGPHAEVNAIENSGLQDLSQTELYVSLEPCSHFGKTPPCSDLIISRKIPKVIIGCRDPFEKVNGNGIKILKENGIEVIEGILEKDCLELNKRFIISHQLKRPYIILKWAETSNGLIAGEGSTEKKISNEITDILVHKWRSEEAGIMAGTNTVLFDNPKLDVRLWPGKNPVRIILDLKGKVPSTHHVFNNISETIVFTRVKGLPSPFEYIPDDNDVLEFILKDLHKKNIQSILVEGGTQLINNLMERDLWDEARVIKTDLFFKKGLKAPLIMEEISGREFIKNDQYFHYNNSNRKVLLNF